MRSNKASRLVAGIVVASAFGWSGGIYASPVTAPGDLAGITLIDFEAYAVGTLGPIVEFGATITGTPPGISVISDSTPWTQYPGIVEKKIFGFTPGIVFNIVFDTPVARVGLGVFDPNYPLGAIKFVNTFNAYDAGGNLLDSSTSGSSNFPVGAPGGGFSTYIGFEYATNTVKRVELIGAGNGEVLGIDNVSFRRVAQVPEPGTFALLLAGFAGVAGAVWRPAKKKSGVKLTFYFAEFPVTHSAGDAGWQFVPSDGVGRFPDAACQTPPRPDWAPLSGARGDRPILWQVKVIGLRRRVSDRRPVR